MGWCRESMASCRRPYGVDHFDLTIAFSGDEGRVSNLNYSKLRVQQLYDESFAHQLLETLSREARGAGTTALHVAVGLFSWGDALDQALGPNEAAAG